MSKKKNPDNRRSLKADLTDEEMAAFQRAHAPISQVDAMTLIVKWFTRQDDTIRKEVLGLIPEEWRGLIARRMLERMAGGETESAHPLDAVADEDLDAAEHEGDVPKPQDKPDQNDKAHG